MEPYFLEHLAKAIQQDLEKDFMHIHLARAYSRPGPSRMKKIVKSIRAKFYQRRKRNRDHRSSSSEPRITNPGSTHQECCPCCMN